MRSPLRALVPTLVSVLCALILLRMSWTDSRYFLPFTLILVLSMIPVVLARWRMRKILTSGDVSAILDAWRRSIERVVYPETMAPLMIATAYASHGWNEHARTALGRAAKGSAWEAAREQRLFVETLVETFEGNAHDSLVRAAELVRLPLPNGGVLVRRRVAALREGVAALARAFAHAAAPGDEVRLERAASASPFVHWAMRYARAILAIDRGRAADARALLLGAPEWPKESAFASFQRELDSHFGTIGDPR
ncbi:hypothetical protein BH09MYX1_BH09MYX1_15460 [soil metagenome]